MNFSSILGNKRKISKLSQRAELIMQRTQELIKEPTEKYLDITKRLQAELKKGKTEEDI